jgi:hypothetical protein
LGWICLETSFIASFDCGIIMSSTSQLKAGRLQGNGSGEARRTRQQLLELKKKGSLLGYFGKVARGRPPKKATLSVNDATHKRKDAPSTTDLTKKKTRTKWSAEENFTLN